MNRILAGYSRRFMACDTPGKCRLVACGHAVGLLYVMGIVFTVSVGRGQWLETKITLPDSLGGATGPTCLTTDTSERYVYIGDGSGAVYVVDAEARSRVARVPCSGYVSALCTNTGRDKVYAADDVGSQVLVISCATNQVVAAVPTGVGPRALCYNSTDDKIYAANYSGGDITVIDCSSDSAIKTMHLGKNPARLCYNPTSNRIFCVSESLWVGAELTVIDGASDMVVTAYAGTWTGPMVVNTVANRVYASNQSGLHALDGMTGVVLDTMNAVADFMCLDSRTQKLYTGGKDNPVEVMIFDCTADTLIDWLRLSGGSYIFSMACDTATHKVYASCNWHPYGDLLVVMDGMTDTIAATPAGPNRGELLVSSKRGRVYATDRYGPELVVFDARTDSLLRTIMIGGGATPMCYDSIDGKVYYVSYSVLGEAGAIDALTNQPVGRTQVGRYPQDVVWHAPTNRVYCSGANLVVIDPTVDTATKVLPLSSGLICSAPSLNKVYAFNPADNEVAVIDCRSDSIIRTIPVPTDDAWSMCYVASDKLYVGGYGAVSIVDCVGDTLIRSYPFNFSRLVPGRDGKQVYCWQPYSLSTFDTGGDTIVVEEPWDAAGGVDLLYVQSLNKVYCADRSKGCVLVADGATDTVTAEIPLYEVSSLGYDSANDILYCGHGLDSVIRFVDCRTDSVTGLLSTGTFATEFVMVPARDRVYVGGGSHDNSYIPVIRTDPPGVEEAASPRTKDVAGPTLVSRNSPLMVHQSSLLLDVMGRRVLELTPGLHGLTGREAGVYFLLGCTDGKTVKILLVD